MLACAVPYQDATVVHQVRPVWVEFAHHQLKRRDAVIHVALAANGTILRMFIVESTGDPALDSAALRAAKASTFAPKVVNCKPVPGSYVFRVLFNV